MERRFARRKPSMGDHVYENLPMLTMWALGTLIIAYFGWLAAVTYLVFCGFSIVWFTRFICSYCVNSRTGWCEGGLGSISAAMFSPNEPKQFGRQFKMHIAIQFPIWFVPPILAVYALWTEFSYAMVVLLVVFCIVAFVVLPLAAQKKSCDECAMRKVCPFAKSSVPEKGSNINKRRPSASDE